MTTIKQLRKQLVIARKKVKKEKERLKNHKTYQKKKVKYKNSEKELEKLRTIEERFDKKIRSRFLNNDSHHSYYRRSTTYIGESNTNIKGNVISAIKSRIKISKLRQSEVEKLVNTLIDIERKDNTNLQKIHKDIDKLEKETEVLGEEVNKFEEKFEELDDKRFKVWRILEDIKEQKKNQKSEKYRKRVKSETSRDRERNKVDSEIDNIYKKLEKIEGETKMRQHKVKTRGGITVLRELIVKKDCKDLKGFGISRGTKLFVIKEGPVHPTEKHKILVVRVDNGTGMLNLCPETYVRDNEVE